jgi:predicted nuclease of predicted toxin-antitoxin system
VIRLYMDENVGDAITDALRLRGVDVVAAQEDGMRGKPDAQVLDRATSLGRVVFTFDYDFYAEARDRLAAGGHFAGVIYARQLSVTIGQCVRDLEIICLAGEPEDLADRIDRLPL